MLSQVFLDMDGVLCDFVGGASKAHGRSSGGLRGEWNLEKAWNLSCDDFWRPLLGYDFWINLRPFEWCDALLALFPLAIIATRPADSAGSYAAKYDWCKRYLGRKLIMVNTTKVHLSREGTVLIDDYDKNVEEFNEGEGRAVLFPQDWNSRWAFSGDKVDYIRSRVYES